MILIGLFLVLPFVVAAGVLWFVSWRGDKGPPPIRTSHVLEVGEPGSGLVMAVKSFGGFLDARPMVRFDLAVTVGQGEPFNIQVTQSIPRRRLSDVSPGTTVDVRVLPDHAAAAIVLGDADD